MELENVMNAVKEIGSSVNEIKESSEKAKAELEARLEQIERAKAAYDKGMVDDNETAKEKGKTYGFLHARKDIANGKVARTPMWDDRTEKRFNEYLHMLYEKDYKGIEKAFGDNVQDNISNWTPTEFRSEIVRLAYQNSLALQKCTIVPMGRDKISMPAPSGGYTVSWVDAGSAMTDSKITAGKVDLDTAKLGAIALVNAEDLDDSAYPVALVVADKMGEDFGKKIDTEVFQGDADGSDQFDGWEYASNVNEITGGVDATPTFAELLTEDNLLDAVAELDDAALDGAEWFFNTAGWAAIRAIEDGASSKIVRLNENWKYDLLGYPVNTRSQVAPTATAARAAGFFGNMKHIYIGDRMDFRVDTSEHYRFANDQVVFRGLQRLAIAVGIPTALVRIVFGAAS